MRPRSTASRFQERVDDLVRGAHAAIGDAIGNGRPASVRALAPGGSEHGIDEGSVGVDRGGHDHDVVRLQARVAVEQGQQLVVQHLDLAHRAVAGVHGDGSIRGGDRQGRTRGMVRAAVAQGEDVGLQRRQHAARTRITVQVAVPFLVVGVRLQDLLEVATDEAEGGEQRVSLLEVEIGSRRGGVALAPGHLAPDLAPRPDLGPVLRRRAEQEQVHLHLRGQGDERSQDRGAAGSRCRTG